VDRFFALASAGASPATTVCNPRVVDRDKNFDRNAALADIDLQRMECVYDQVRSQRTRKLVIGLMAGNDRKVAPVFSDLSTNRVGFRASSKGWMGRRLPNDLTILDESGEKVFILPRVSAGANDH